MQELASSIWFTTQQYTTWTYTFLRTQWLHTFYPFLQDCWLQYWEPISSGSSPVERYFLGTDAGQDMELYLTVPEGNVYIEEWRRGDVKKCVVRYAGETVPRSWTESPFDKIPRSPWIWVGDRETEIDLTRTFNRFLVVGNRITKELVHHYVRVTPKTRLMYIEAGTFKELEFPGEGITIQEYDN